MRKNIQSSRNRAARINPVKPTHKKEIVLSNRRLAPIRFNQRSLDVVANPSVASSEKILITGAIGDFFAIESLFSETHRQVVKTIYYATRQHKLIREAIESLPNWRHVQNHVLLWEDFTNFFAFFRIGEVWYKRQKANMEMPAGHEAIVDWSVMTIFDLFNRSRMIYYGSSFVRFKVADVACFGLPNNYITICPYSVNGDQKRNFDKFDWDQICKHLEKRCLYAVVLNQGGGEVPRHKYLLNLSNQTTLSQSIEILKASQGYIGIDSCLSVLAAKIFNTPDLMIKTVNSFCINNSRIYYAPRMGDEFLVNRIAPYG